MYPENTWDSTDPWNKVCLTAPKIYLKNLLNQFKRKLWKTNKLP
jgi:hypothetical protein